MNKHEVRGSVRHVGGAAEKAIGDVVDSNDLRVGGVVDQVAGSAEHLFGRVKSIAEDAADATPGLIEAARDRVEDAAHRSAHVARKAAHKAKGEPLWIGTAVAAIAGYAIGALVHRRRG
ncbi:CsbD family protein [Sphingomonas sp. Y38-1Y]|uniref:CsbD family protein n=1 Tax=Sphingomonas sp. Y38-1Y TaxID=3078265 RepID=UPI0028E3E370|nr:CsbD family protein [Sphingomonas sp. Y38-1Y]